MKQSLMPRTGWAVILAVLVTACAPGPTTSLTATCAAGQRQPTAPSFTGPVPPGLDQAISDLLLLNPAPQLVIHNVLVKEDVAFVIFSFDEERRRSRAFASFVRRADGWINDHLATDLWPKVPAACSGQLPVLALQTAGISCTGGFVDPTIDRVVAKVGTETVAEARPIAGSILLLAPVGSDVIAYRDQQVVARRRVQDLPVSPGE